MNLRFIERDGQSVLQQLCKSMGEGGLMEFEWLDVPLIDLNPKPPPGLSLKQDQKPEEIVTGIIIAEAFRRAEIGYFPHGTACRKIADHINQIIHDADCEPRKIEVTAKMLDAANLADKAFCVANMTCAWSPSDYSERNRLIIEAALRAM